ADAPTTGGVWISVVSAADLRVAVEGATVGFAGPRVVEAVTGVRPVEGSHTATSAHRAGLVDEVLSPGDVCAWLDRALAALAPGTAGAVEPRTGTAPSDGGWTQVERARGRSVGGVALLGTLLDGEVRLRAARGDATVAAAVGRIAGLPVVGVALAAEVGSKPSPDGYRLAARAYRLAGRLGLPVLSLVDTPGADPGTESEEGGIAPAMGEALDALLTCPSPTVALVHGEGGSGGALAASAADLLLVTADSYFAAIGPEGASAALRRSPQECADLMGITPADLLALGAADALLDEPGDVAAHLARLCSRPAADRLTDRRRRWSNPLPGTL
ncbi:MAG: carboxyl transferase, partial [Frankiales bacterium]|nr:carboxyl transferase [Frankiales bacterium]